MHTLMRLLLIYSSLVLITNYILAFFFVKHSDANVRNFGWASVIIWAPIGVLLALLWLT